MTALTAFEATTERVLREHFFIDWRAEGDGWQEPLSEEPTCQCGLVLGLWIQTDPDCSDRPEWGPIHAAHVTAALMAAYVAEHGLREDEQWRPVAESGHRWAGRERDHAARDMAEFPVGAVWPGTDDPIDGITHIDHESRLTTDWHTDTGSDE